MGRYPPGPLLNVYCTRQADPILAERTAALDTAQRLLAPAWLDSAKPADFAESLVAAYEQLVPFPCHTALLHAQAGLIRHGLTHLVRCPDPMPDKLARCLAADGAYRVLGLGRVFWSSICQAIDPQQYPVWTDAVVRGLGRLGLFAPAHGRGGEPLAVNYAQLIAAFAQLRRLAARPVNTVELTHFLHLVAHMHGRELPRDWIEPTGTNSPLAECIRQVRTATPLRRRIREQGERLAAAQTHLTNALAQTDAHGLAVAVQSVVPGLPELDADQLTALLRVASDSRSATDPLTNLGEWLKRGLPIRWLAAVLHLLQPQRFVPVCEATFSGWAQFDDSLLVCADSAERYQLLTAGVQLLCERAKLHMLEVPDVLRALAALRADESTACGLVASTQTGGEPTASSLRGPRFGGFCADTFAFLDELAHNNHRDWMAAQRSRYHFVLRQPLVELCESLAQRYVIPVLQARHGWAMETAARPGRAITSITKNDHGRSMPYQDAMWVVFTRQVESRQVESRQVESRQRSREDVQWFVRVRADGVQYGVCLSPKARQAGRLFRRNVQAHAEHLQRALHQRGALLDCRFGHDHTLAEGRLLRTVTDLRTWATGKTLVVGKRLAPDNVLLRYDELVDEILLTFDALLPIFVYAVSAEPLAVLPLAESVDDADDVRASAFCAATHLPLTWLESALELLQLKRQLILQGVPGTGKTYIARALANYLAGDDPARVRLVQFHPAYSYEEFVEGIKPRTHRVDGRTETCYPVEDGLLTAFASEAANHPETAYVLLIDEINRGNLPRIFGELLYLLEYRTQSVTLPTSRRAFRLPENLYLIGTMNAADRSIVGIDQALRRRFSFVEVRPSPAVLAGWLEQHPPRDGEGFIKCVVELFETLNRKLEQDLGAHWQVGHSYFMVPELDMVRLRAIWQHQIAPLLTEYFTGRAPEQLRAYDLDTLLGQRRRSPGLATPVT